MGIGVWMSEFIGEVTFGYGKSTGCLAVRILQIQHKKLEYL